MSDKKGPITKEDLIEPGAIEAVEKLTKVIKNLHKALDDFSTEYSIEKGSVVNKALEFLKVGGPDGLKDI